MFLFGLLPMFGYWRRCKLAAGLLRGGRRVIGMLARRPDVPVDPFVDGFVPELGVLRLDDPVSLVGEVEHAAGNLETLQGGEELEAFADIEAVVELAMDDEGWSFEVGARPARATSDDRADDSTTGFPRTPTR